MLSAPPTHPLTDRDKCDGIHRLAETLKAKMFQVISRIMRANTGKITCYFITGTTLIDIA